jgi:hypothetical protein
MYLSIFSIVNKLHAAENASGNAFSCNGGVLSVPIRSNQCLEVLAVGWAICSNHYVGERSVELTCLKGRNTFFMWKKMEKIV